MENLISSFTYGPSSILIKELLDIFKDFTCYDSYSQLFGKISKNTLKILAIASIYRLFVQQDNKKLDWLFTPLIYRKYRFDMSKVSVENCLANRLKRLTKADETIDLKNNYLPIYFYQQSEYGVLMMVPILHSAFYREQLQLAEQDYQEYLEANNVNISVCKTVTSNTYKPKVLFPSSNYVNLLSLVKNHFDVCKLLNSYSTIGILLDGEPGLGKTDSLDFLARHKVCDEVLKIDMTTQLHHEFDKIISTIFQIMGLNTSKVILIDELDKYLDYRVSKSYTELKDDNKPDYVDYKVTYKQNFMYELLGLIEGKDGNKNIVFIFCANNFKTIFEGLDITHYQSLYDRFLKITFNRCDATEFAKYCQYLNDKFKGSKWYRQDLDQLLSTIKSDLSIPYRHICQESIKANYNIANLITNVNNWIEIKLDSPPTTPTNQIHSVAKENGYSHQPKSSLANNLDNKSAGVVDKPLMTVSNKPHISKSNKYTASVADKPQTQTVNKPGQESLIRSPAVYKMFDVYSDYNKKLFGTYIHNAFNKLDTQLSKNFYDLPRYEQTKQYVTIVTDKMLTAIERCENSDKQIADAHITILCKFLTDHNMYYTFLDQQDKNSIRRYLGKVLKWLDEGIFTEGPQKVQGLLDYL